MSSQRSSVSVHVCTVPTNRARAPLSIAALSAATETTAKKAEHERMTSEQSRAFIAALSATACPKAP